MKTRPPKLRFPPGTFVRFPDTEAYPRVYEVVYAYRTHEDPHEWRYLLRRSHFEKSSYRKVFWDPIHTVSGQNVSWDTWELCRSNTEMLHMCELAIDDIMDS